MAEFCFVLFLICYFQLPYVQLVFTSVVTMKDNIPALCNLKGLGGNSEKSKGNIWTP